MLHDFFARMYERCDATAERACADATVDRIVSANEYLRTKSASSCSIEHGIARVLTSAEIATIIDGIDEF